MSEPINLNKQQEDNATSTVQDVNINNASLHNSVNTTLLNSNNVNKFDNIEFNDPAEQLAGFWLRFVAHIIDLFAITLIVIVPLMFILFVLVIISDGNVDSLDSAITLLTIGSIALVAALFESSKFQATPGKMCLGLIVVDRLGEKMKFGPAYGRTLLKYATLLLGITGFIHVMAAFTKKKQSVHDLALNTYVVKKSQLVAIKEYNAKLRSLNGLDTSVTNNTGNSDQHSNIIL